MQAIFAVLFILGVVVGYLLPGDVKYLARQMSGNPLKPAVFDIPKRIGQLDLSTPYFRYSVLAETETGGIELVKVDDKIPLHMHPKENHFVYIYKGKARGTVGSITAEVEAGQLVAIPAGVPHSFERIGDSPVEIILFSTPPFMPNDTVFLEKK